MRLKKAQLGNAIIWFYRFFLIIIIALVFVLIISNFLYLKNDVRQAEAVLLEKRVADCLTDKGIIINQNFEKETLKECIGFRNFDKDEIDEYYISATLNYQNSSSDVELGNADLRELCNLKGNVPICLSQDYYVLVKKDDNLETAKLNIFIAILKLEDRYMNI